MEGSLSITKSCSGIWLKRQFEWRNLQPNTSGLLDTDTEAWIFFDVGCLHYCGTSLPRVSYYVCSLVSQKSLIFMDYLV